MSLEEKMDELELGVSGKMRKGGMRQSELNLSTLAQSGAQQLVGFGMLPDQVRAFHQGYMFYYTVGRESQSYPKTFINLN